MLRSWSASRWLAFVALALGSAFPLALLVLRARFSGSFGFRFLVWNLFLAWIPLGFALVVELGWRRQVPRWWLLVPGTGWLLFFPNAPYIVTDLIHLAPRDGTPLWYDALILFSMAIAGLAVGFTSLRIIQLVVAASKGPVLGWVVALGVLGLSGFGIYLGRFGRYNSWDLLSRPRTLLYDVSEVATSPFSNAKAIAVSALFSGFLVVTYLGQVALGRLEVPERHDVDTSIG